MYEKEDLDPEIWFWEQDEVDNGKKPELWISRDTVVIFSMDFMEFLKNSMKSCGDKKVFLEWWKLWTKELKEYNV